LAGGGGGARERARGASLQRGSLRWSGRTAGGGRLPGLRELSLTILGASSPGALLLAAAILSRVRRRLILPSSRSRAGRLPLCKERDQGPAARVPGIARAARAPGITRDAAARDAAARDHARGSTRRARAACALWCYKEGEDFELAPLRDEEAMRRQLEVSSRASSRRGGDEAPT